MARRKKFNFGKKLKEAFNNVNQILTSTFIENEVKIKLFDYQKDAINDIIKVYDKDPIEFRNEYQGEFVDLSQERATHNRYREYERMQRNDAVDALMATYPDMGEMAAARARIAEEDMAAPKPTVDWQKEGF
jgi:hypothetical protein